MSEPVKDEAPDDVAPQTAHPGKKKGKLIAIAAAGLLVAGGGGAAAWTMLGGGGEGEEAAHEAAPEAGAYVEVPPMTVNLRSGDGKPRFLKLRFILVAQDPANEDVITEKLPLILDGFQPFLRELRPEDLAGSAAVFRLKEEMLSRAARVAGRGVVTDVLIQDLIQQ
ncbi:flagellar basal body protein FliL [Sphingomonas parva]|uniref:Flagellar protein FliL n=1 Tax=Sphingomonas parva TaxID=2555898 RepID=A0A4Y8ZQK9_9SPHN|nr:flagellar basal body-associated FliL family protein [Sphingomonas parva]TFI57109.1 flagellar basal body protein FliL [Sphingomonas parva]